MTHFYANNLKITKVDLHDAQFVKRLIKLNETTLCNKRLRKPQIYFDEELKMQIGYFAYQFIFTKFHFPRNLKIFRLTH